MGFSHLYLAICTYLQKYEIIQNSIVSSRTPWCVAFHPSHEGLLASGCLGGHVRIWDLKGGSEIWQTDTVINSLAFHPTERLLGQAHDMFSRIFCIRIDEFFLPNTM